MTILAAPSLSPQAVSAESGCKWRGGGSGGSGGGGGGGSDNNDDDDDNDDDNAKLEFCWKKKFLQK